MKTTHRKTIAALLSSMSAGAGLHAANFTWSDVTTPAATWQAGTNWTGNSAPSASTDNATIGSAFTAAKTINLTGNVTLNNLTLTNTGFAVTIAGATAGKTLTLTNSTNGGTGSAIYYNNTVTNTIGGANLGIVLGSNITYDGGSLGSAFTGLSITGVISDGGSGFGITKTGKRSLSLSGNNTYSGGLTITNGSVFLTTGTTTTNSLGTGDVKFNNSTGADGAAISFGNVSRVYANNFINNNSNTTAGQAPSISAQNFTGFRVTTLSGNFTLGANYIGANSTQTLALGSNGNSVGLGEGSIVLTGNWTGYTAGANADGIRIGSSGSVVLNSANALAPTNYSITVNDTSLAGKLILNDAYTLNQKVTFAGSANGMRNSFGTRTANSTTATLAGDSTGNALTVTDTDGGNVFAQNSGSKLVISGNVTGAGAGGLRVNDAYTYTSADSTNGIQTPTGTVEFSKSTGNTIAGPVTVVNGTLLVTNSSGNGTGSGAISIGTFAAANTSPIGANAATSRLLTGVNTATATALAIGQSVTGAGGTITGTITGISLGSNATNSTVLISNTITSANATLTDLAFGAQTTTATLQLGNNDATGSLNPGSSITINSGSKLKVNRSDAAIQGTHFSTAVISGAGGFEQAGSGSTTFTANNTYTGPTTISAGSLKLGNGGTSGALSPSSAITNNANLTISRSNAVVQGTDFNSAAISGNGSFTQAGAGITTLNAANTYSGGTSVTGGTLLVNNTTGSGTGSGDVSVSSAILGGSGSISGNVGLSSATIGSSGSTLAVGGNLTSAGASSVAASSIVNVAGTTSVSSGTLTVNGALGVNGSIGGAGTVTVSSTGSLTGNATISNATTLSGGTFGSSGNTLNLGSTLDVSGTNSIGSGVIVNVTGTTTISSGVFSVNGTLGGSGGKIVGNTATLKGNGFINGLTTVQSGGSLAPGNSPGLETFTSGLTLETGSTFSFDLNNNSAAGRGTVFDGVDVTGGTFTLQTGVNFNIVLNGSGSTTDFNDAFWASDHSWLVFANTNTPTISGSFVLGSITTDASANTFGTAATANGAFGFSQTGNDVYLNYTYTAIPEPSTYAALAGLGVIGLVVYRRRTSAKTGRAA